MSTLDSASFAIEVVTSQLSIAAAGLSAGQSTTTVSDTTGFLPDRFGDQEINWVQTFHYDETRNIAWGMCQRHSSGDYAPFHFEYDEATDVWTCEECTPSLVDGAAHVFSLPSYDIATGNRYYLEEGGRTAFMERWEPGDNLSDWTQVGDDMNTDIAAMMNNSARLVSGAGAMAFHPNLFGAGNPGLVLIAQEGLVQYRVSTGVYSILIPDDGSITDGGVEPGLIYCRGLDSVVVCSNNSAADRRAWLIEAGGTVTAIEDTPVQVGPDFDGSPGACPVDDPLEGNRIYLLEREGTQRVWTYNNTLDQWDLEGFNHPFEGRTGREEDFMCAAVYGKGCIWGLENDSSTTNIRDRLWRPDS